MSVGLRERKKRATQDALSCAALDLALAKGLDAVTAEAIAELAGVSTRTFHNYFASKEAAILFVLNKSIAEGIALVALRSPDEPIMDSLEAMQVDFVGSADGLERMLAVTQLMAQSPALTAKHAATFDPAINELLAEIGRRTGTDPDTDIYPRLVYHATGAITRAALEIYARHARAGQPYPRRALIDAIHDGYAQLRRGLPQPTPAGGPSTHAH